MSKFQQLKNAIGIQERNVQTFVRMAEESQEKLATALVESLGATGDAVEFLTIKADRESQEQSGDFGALSADGYHYKMRVKFDAETFFEIDCLMVPHAGGVAAKIGEELIPLQHQDGIQRWALQQIDELESKVKNLGIVAKLAQKIETQSQPAARSKAARFGFMVT